MGCAERGRGGNGDRTFIPYLDGSRVDVGAVKLWTGIVGFTMLSARSRLGCRSLFFHLLAIPSMARRHAGL